MEWLDALSRHGVRAHLVEVADPAEESFPYAGRTEFSDPETGEKLTAGRAELLSQDYRALYAARREALSAWCQASGLELHGQPHRPARLRGPGSGSHGDDGRFRTGRRPLSWLPLSFGFPAVLWGLLALPVIWWLLRLTPPRPQTEVFPPLKILARVLRREETPHQSPWWLTLLRLIMAALVVLALAEPIFNPREPLPAASAGLALVIDNGWASAPDWDRRVATAERILADAHAGNAPVILAFTAEKPNVEIGPFDAAAARDRLRAAVPRPVPVDRRATYPRVAQALVSLPGASVAVLADGLATPADRDAFAVLLGSGVKSLVWAVPDRLDADRPDAGRERGRRFRAEGGARARRRPRGGHRRRL